MTRHLAAYYAEHSVRVNCISPGPFPKDGTNPEMVGRLCEKLPMKRMGRPHELKGNPTLARERRGELHHGAEYTVDGGWLAW